jgi:hypothetical protein
LNPDFLCDTLALSMKYRVANPQNGLFRSWRNGVAIFFVATLASTSTALAIPYTERQLEALAERIGRTFWVTTVNNRTPSFRSAPASNAPVFRVQPNDSFEITDLVGRKSEQPFYKVKFASGKDGYISPDSFHEELNLTILSVDPQADEKKKTAAAGEDEKKRLEWIQAQPWSQAVKQAAIQRRPVPGMKTGEVNKILGKPTRVTRIQAPQRFGEEHWFYADGSVLIFQNGLLIRIEPKEKKD